MHFPVSLRWTAYIIRKHTKGGSKMQMQNGCFMFKKCTCLVESPLQSFFVQILSVA